MLAESHAAWIGRVEKRSGALTPVVAGMLGAALGHPASPPPRCEPRVPLPFLWHWSAFPEFVPHGEIGRDGHPRLGRFLPPVPLERRMWAGGRLSFGGVLHVGEALHRRSEILSVDEKAGATGPMVFVTVAHRIEGEGGGVIDEEQDIVYLAMPDAFRPPKPVPAPDSSDFAETLTVDEVRLFRYSAATYNAHRIHYDLPYAREVEKYPGLVVHGPMQATLLIEAAMRHAGRLPTRFRFRGIHPMFAPGELRLLGTDDGEAMELCTAAPEGHQGLQARVEWA